MKKVLILICSFILILSITSFSYAEETGDVVILASPLQIDNKIKVKQNEEIIDFKDSNGNEVNPQIINGRTMVPFRKIFNSLGVTDDNISWNGDTRTVNAKKDEIEIELQIDNSIAKKIVSGDILQIELDSAPVIIDGRTMVPVRFIAESMNKTVGWDAQSRTVIILDTKELIENLEQSIPKYMKIINSEQNSPSSSSSKMDLTGKLEYKSKLDKSKNQTLSLSGKINNTTTSDSLSIDGSFKITGKGELMDSIKESNMVDVEFKVIANENKLYYKSSSSEESTNGKWIVMEDDSVKELFLLMNKEENISLYDIFKVDEEYLTVNTYEQMKMICDFLKNLLKDDNIEIKEKGKTITYTITIKISDVLEFLKEIGMEVKDEGIDGTIKMISTLKNKIPQNNSCEIDIHYAEGDESVDFSLKANGTISSKTNKISIPDSSQVIKADEIS